MVNHGAEGEAEHRRAAMLATGQRQKAPCLLRALSGRIPEVKDLSTPHKVLKSGGVRALLGHLCGSSETSLDG